MRLIKWLSAIILINYSKFPINELQRKRMNHLLAIKQTKGRVKWDWNKILCRQIITCYRCCVVVEGPDRWCDKCWNSHGQFLKQRSDGRWGEA